MVRKPTIFDWARHNIIPCDTVHAKCAGKWYNVEVVHLPFATRRETTLVVRRFTRTRPRGNVWTIKPGQKYEDLRLADCVLDDGNGIPITIAEIVAPFPHASAYCANEGVV